MSKKDFGKKLQKIRKSRGLTQAKLGELTGLSEKHISRIESGAYFPTYDTLNKLLKALNASVEDVGLDIERAIPNDNPYYLKSLQILNSVEDAQEYKLYYDTMRQMQKAIEALKS